MEQSQNFREFDDFDAKITVFAGILKNLLEFRKHFFELWEHD